MTKTFLSWVLREIMRLTEDFALALGLDISMQPRPRKKWRLMEEVPERPKIKPAYMRSKFYQPRNRKH